jgi:hypothetical protein
MLSHMFFSSKQRIRLQEALSFKEGGYLSLLPAGFGGMDGWGNQD